MNLFLFHGPDTYSSQEKINLWRQQFEKKYNGDFNIITIEGKQLTCPQYISDTDSLPFLADKRLVIIQDFLANGKKEELKKIADRLEKTPDHSIVIFHEQSPPDKRTSIFKKLKKHGTLEEFTTPEGIHLQKWLQKKATQKQCQLDNQAATTLITRIGPNLWQLDQELQKLKLYRGQNPITQQDVQDLTSQNFSESIFTLTDSVAQNNPRKSLQILQTLIASDEDITRIFYMLARHFRILLQVQDLLEKHNPEKAITTALKQHPFVIKKSSQQARQLPKQKLLLTYKTLLAIEIAMKSGQIQLRVDDKRDLILALEKTILHLCR